MKNFLLGLALLLGLSSPSLAQAVVEVPPGRTVKIDRHSVCRMVENIGNTPFMVPTRTASEWSTGNSSFIGIEPSGVRLRNCGYEAICKPAARNYSHVETLPATMGQVSPDGNLYMAGGSDRIFIYGRNGSNWSQRQVLSLNIGRNFSFLPYRKFIGFSPDGTRAVAILSHTENNRLDLLELNQNASGVWSMQHKTVARNSPGGTMISSVRFGEDADTVVFAWNTDNGSLPAASILKRGAGGAWSISGNLPRPGGAISPVDVWLFDEGTRAYVTGENEQNNNFWISRTVEYRFASGSWSISRNNPPAHTISADGLKGASSGSAGGPFSDTITYYERENPGLPFQKVDEMTIGGSSCCMRPTMSDDGTTIATLDQSGGALAPARLRAFIVNNGNLVAKGIAAPAGGDFITEFPTLSWTGDVMFNNGLMAHGCALP